MGGTPYQPLDQTSEAPGNNINVTVLPPINPQQQQQQQVYQPQQPAYSMAQPGVYPVLPPQQHQQQQPQQQPSPYTYPAQLQTRDNQVYNGPVGQPLPPVAPPPRKRRGWMRRQFKKTEVNSELYSTSNSTSRAVLPVHGGFVRLLHIDTTYYPEFQPYFSQEEFRDMIAEINATLADLGPKYHVLVHAGAILVGVWTCGFGALAVWGVAYLIMRRRRKRAMRAVRALLDRKNAEIFSDRGVTWRVGDNGVDIDLPTGVVVSHLVPESIVDVADDLQAHPVPAGTQRYTTLPPVQQQHQQQQQQQQPQPPYAQVYSPAQPVPNQPYPNNNNNNYNYSQQ